MNDIELQEILNSYKWIKVKQYHKPNQPSDWQLQHELLEIHHRRETEFLIEKCRELAQELIETKKKVPWSTHQPHKDEWGNTDWRDTGEMGG
jgi:hypothetical protein